MLKCGHINVGGWTVNNQDLRVSLIKNINTDIISVNETHLGGDDTLDLKSYGFEWYGHNRFATHRNAPKPSGGVGFLVKQSVFNSFHVRVLDKAYDGILGLELRHKDTDTSIAMFTCYLPPENSPWGRDADSFFRIY